MELSRYFPYRSHPNHAHLKAIEVRFVGCDSIYQFQARTEAAWLRLSKKDAVPAVHITGGSSHSADLSVAEAWGWLDGMVAAMEIKVAVVAAHFGGRNGRFDFHILTPNCDQEGRSLVRRGFHLKTHLMGHARKLTTAINVKRLAIGKHTIGNLDQDWRVYYLQKEVPLSHELGEIIPVEKEPLVEAVAIAPVATVIVETAPVDEVEGGTQSPGESPATDASPAITPVVEKGERDIREILEVKSGGISASKPTVVPKSPAKATEVVPIPPVIAATAKSAREEKEEAEEKIEKAKRKKAAEEWAAAIAGMVRAVLELRHLRIPAPDLWKPIMTAEEYAQPPPQRPTIETLVIRHNQNSRGQPPESSEGRLNAALKVRYQMILKRKITDANAMIHALRAVTSLKVRAAAVWKPIMKTEECALPLPQWPTVNDLLVRLEKDNFAKIPNPERLQLLSIFHQKRRQEIIRTQEKIEAMIRAVWDGRSSLEHQASGIWEPIMREEEFLLPQSQRPTINVLLRRLNAEEFVMDPSPEPAQLLELLETFRARVLQKDGDDKAEPGFGKK